MVLFCCFCTHHYDYGSAITSCSNAAFHWANQEFRSRLSKIRLSFGIFCWFFRALHSGWVGSRRVESGHVGSEPVTRHRNGREQCSRTETRRAISTAAAIAGKFALCAIWSTLCHYLFLSSVVLANGLRARFRSERDEDSTKANRNGSFEWGFTRCFTTTARALRLPRPHSARQKLDPCAK